MPRRQFITNRSFRRSRRETQWLEMPVVNTTLAAASTAALVLVLTTAEKAMRPFTIVRTRMFFHVASDQVAADESQSCALGIAVVSDQAVAIGVTAVPTPDTDRGSDLWLVYEEMFSKLVIGGTADSVGLVGMFQKVDSKAMRKVEEGQDVAVVIETTPSSSGVIAAIGGRLLIKLH